MFLQMEYIRYVFFMMVAFVIVLEPLKEYGGLENPSS
jgi:hypothetical protein